MTKISSVKSCVGTKGALHVQTRPQSQSRHRLGLSVSRLNRTEEDEVGVLQPAVQAGYIALGSRLSLLGTHAQPIETIKAFEGAVEGSTALSLSVRC